MADTKLVNLLTATTVTSTQTGSAVATQTGAYKTYPGTQAQPKRMKVFLDVTTSTGTSETLDLIVQGQHTTSGTWFTLAPEQCEATLAWAQVTAPTTQYRDFVGPIPPNLRAVGTVGGTTPTFSFAVDALLEY